MRRRCLRPLIKFSKELAAWQSKRYTVRKPALRLVLMTLQEIIGAARGRVQRADSSMYFRMRPSPVMLLGEEADEGRLIVDENEWPISLALQTGKGWKATNFMLRGPTGRGGRTFRRTRRRNREHDQEDWMRATREYYSLKLMQTVPPAMEDYSPQRGKTVRALLTEVWGDRTGATCLDCGCGSGHGIDDAPRDGYRPLSPSITMIPYSAWAWAGGDCSPRRRCGSMPPWLGHYVRPSRAGPGA